MNLRLCTPIYDQRRSDKEERGRLPVPPKILGLSRHLKDGIDDITINFYMIAFNLFTIFTSVNVISSIIRTWARFVFVSRYTKQIHTCFWRDLTFPLTAPPYAPGQEVH